MRAAVLAASAVIGASLAGRVLSAQSVGTWYRTLSKPSFNPPNWAFPVAWTLLFVLMGIGFWRVLRLPAATAGRRGAIGLFWLQLALNVGWSAAFFGARSAVAGMIVVVPFLAAIVATGLAFRRVDRTAGLLFIPYVGWVSFAVVLNGAIVAMN